MALGSACACASTALTRFVRPPGVTRCHHDARACMHCLPERDPGTEQRVRLAERCACKPLPASALAICVRLAAALGLVPSRIPLGCLSHPSTAYRTYATGTLLQLAPSSWCAGQTVHNHGGEHWQVEGQDPSADRAGDRMVGGGGEGAGHASMPMVACRPGVQPQSGTRVVGTESMPSPRQPAPGSIHTRTPSACTCSWWQRAGDRLAANAANAVNIGGPHTGGRWGSTLAHCVLVRVPAHTQEASGGDLCQERAVGRQAVLG